MDTKNVLAASIAATLAPAMLNHSIDEAQPACIAPLPTTALTVSACLDKAAALQHDHRDPQRIAPGGTYFAPRGITVTPTYQPTTGITVTPA
jgi:hypothetical protein